MRLSGYGKNVIIIAMLFFIASLAGAQSLPKRGKMNRLSVDTLYNTRIDSLSEALRTQTGRIDVSFDEIALRVTDSTFDALEGRTFTLEGQVAVFDTAIQSRVTHTEYNAFGDTLLTWGSYVTQTIDGIQSDVIGKASQSYVDQLSDSINARVRTGEYSSFVSQTASALASKIESPAMESYVNQTVGSFETTIRNKITGDSTSIIQTATSIAFSADTTYVNGLFTAENINAFNIVADSISADAAQFITLSARQITGDTLTGVVINGINITSSSLITASSTLADTYAYLNGGAIGCRQNGSSFGDFVTINGGGVSIRIDGEHLVEAQTTLTAYGLTVNGQTVTADDVISWNAKAEAFTGYTGNFDTGGSVLHFSNGILTGID